MPLLPISLGPSGPLVDVGLSVPRAYSPWGGPPGTWRALIDTGADMTTISSAVVSTLRPMQVGTQPVGRPGGGRTVCDTYDVHLRFGGPAARGRWFNLEVVEIQLAAADVDLLRICHDEAGQQRLIDGLGLTVRRFGWDTGLFRPYRARSWAGDEFPGGCPGAGLFRPFGPASRCFGDRLITLPSSARENRMNRQEDPRRGVRPCGACV